jgi:biopolymer transport protein ExbD
MLMAQLNQPGSIKISIKKRAGVQKPVRQFLKVDMTPMVDLGFLLITFFVFTTELSKPAVMHLAMPKDGLPADLAASAALTVLMKDNTIYYYRGQWEEALSQNQISPLLKSWQKTLRELISNMKMELDKIKEVKGGRNDLMLLIKPGPSTSYATVVDLLDEATISMIKKYAIVKQTTAEYNWLEKQ